MAFKLPYTGRSIKYYTVPVVSCVVLGRFEGFWFCRRRPINQNFYCKVVGGRTKIPQNAQRKKPQVQCNTLLICLCREVWRSFVGNFRTALSHKRNWPWSTTVTDMKAYTKGGAACGLTCTLGLRLDRQPRAKPHLCKAKLNHVLRHVFSPRLATVNQVVG